MIKRLIAYLAALTANMWQTEVNNVIAPHILHSLNTRGVSYNGGKEMTLPCNIHIGSYIAGKKVRKRPRE